MGAGPKKKMQDPVSITLDVERSDLEKLRELAEGEGLSVAELVRRSVSNLAGGRRPRPRRSKTSRS